MSIKRLVTLPPIVILVLCNIGLSQVTYDLIDGKFQCYSLEESGLSVEIEITAFVWPGENTSVTMKATALQANIHIRGIRFNISRLEEYGNKTLLKSTKFLTDMHLTLGEFRETSYDVLIPENSLPGWLYGEVECSWSIEGDKLILTKSDAFPATYIQNKPYENLRQEYEALNSFLNGLQANHTLLENNYTELHEKYEQLTGDKIAQNNATGLMYLFLVTTGIFVMTTILLLARRPKSTTW
ncbi:MAG: hypothetical protein JSV51_05005 [Candidatus Bathyarchaeota archaeon]|nr:MAG: hypothetical protein JSV51_05005 [Candidatus Bathyarchaeota archaeon]